MTSSTRTRKPRSDSTAEMTRIMQGAAIEIAPPAHVALSDQDWPFWHSVVAEFARADWTEHQLELAALLARTMSDLEENQRLLRQEGTIVDRPIISRKTGEVVDYEKAENPRLRSVNTYMAQVHGTRRTLALHVRGSSQRIADARDANKKTERRAKKEDDLLS